MDPARHGINARDATRSSLRVVHVVLSLDVGGLERVVLELARQAVTCHQEVTVLCLVHPGSLAEEAEHSGARVISLSKRPGLTPGLVWRIQSVLRELAPDVVHTHQIGALLYAGPAAKREAVRAIVHTEHINNIAKATTPMKRLRVRGLWWLAGRYAQRFFCVSDDIALAAKPFVKEDKLCVISNGIDVPAFSGRESRPTIRAQFNIPSDAPVVGTVGRLNEVKSQDVLIRAFAGLHAHHPASHLLLVGDGPARQELERLTAELKLTDFVHFAGYQSEPHRFLQAMDLFALPSRMEGMPLAILEAWASKLSVVATRVGGVPKLVEDGKTGLLIEAGDCAALQSRLEQLIENPSLASQIADSGLDQVSHCYSAARMAMDYNRHYHNLLDRAIADERKIGGVQNCRQGSRVKQGVGGCSGTTPSPTVTRGMVSGSVRSHSAD